MTDNKNNENKDLIFNQHRRMLDSINKNNKLSFFFNCFFFFTVLVASISIAGFNSLSKGALNFISAFVFLAISIFAYNDKLIPKYLVSVYYFLSLFVFHNPASFLSFVGLVWSVFSIVNYYKLKELLETDELTYPNERAVKYQPDFITEHTLDKSTNNGEMDIIDGNGNAKPSDIPGQLCNTLKNVKENEENDELVLDYVPVAEDMYAVSQSNEKDTVADLNTAQSFAEPVQPELQEQLPQNAETISPEIVLESSADTIEKKEPVPGIPDKESIDIIDSKQEPVSDTNSSLTSVDEFKNKYENYFNKFDTIYDNDEKIS